MSSFRLIAYPFLIHTPDTNMLRFMTSFSPLSLFLCNNALSTTHPHSLSVLIPSIPLPVSSHTWFPIIYPPIQPFNNPSVHHLSTSSSSRWPSTCFHGSFTRCLSEPVDSGLFYVCFNSEFRLRTCPSRPTRRHGHCLVYASLRIFFPFAVEVTVFPLSVVVFTFTFLLFPLQNIACYRFASHGYYLRTVVYTHTYVRTLYITAHRIVLS